MCQFCNRKQNSDFTFLGLVALAAFVAVVLLLGFGAGACHGAEVKAIPLGTVSQTESPVIAKAMGIGGKPESHDIPKFDLPPAGEAAAIAGIGIAALALFVLQLAGVAVTAIVAVVAGVWAFRKFFGAAVAAKSIPALLTGLDKLVASHRANDALFKAAHSRLAKIVPIRPTVIAPKKSRKKKANVSQTAS